MKCSNQTPKPKQGCYGLNLNSNVSPFICSSRLMSDMQCSIAFIRRFDPFDEMADKQSRGEKWRDGGCRKQTETHFHQHTGDETCMEGTPGTLISGCVCNTVLFAPVAMFPITTWPPRTSLIWSPNMRRALWPPKEQESERTLTLRPSSAATFLSSQKCPHSAEKFLQ